MYHAIFIDWYVAQSSSGRLPDSSKCRQFLRRLRINLLQDTAMPHLGIYLQDTLSYHKETCTTMFIQALFIIPEAGNNPNVPILKNG